MLHKVEPASTFCNNFFQLATMKFAARQVEHAVEIRTTTRSTCNASMLRDKLNKNVAHITGPLRLYFLVLEQLFVKRASSNISVTTSHLPKCVGYPIFVPNVLEFEKYDANCVR